MGTAQGEFVAEGGCVGDCCAFKVVAAQADPYQRVISRWDP